MDDEMDVGQASTVVEGSLSSLAKAELERREESKNLHRKRCREYAKRRRDELMMVHKKMISIYDELVRMGVYPQLSSEAREFFDVYVHREINRRMPFPPTMYKMFGKNIAPGVSCTLRSAMQTLYKGKNEINFLVKKWARNNGVVIDVVPDDSGVALDAKYVIRSVPDIDEGDPDDVSAMMSDTERRKFREFESHR